MWLVVGSLPDLHCGTFSAEPAGMDMEDAIGRPVCIAHDVRLCSRCTCIATVGCSGPVHTKTIGVRIKCITGHLDSNSCSKENSGREITWSSRQLRFKKKTPFSNFFPIYTETQSWRFQILRLEGRFLKPLISWRVTVGDRPNRDVDRAWDLCFSTFS